jgi:hypothetical protein
VGGPVRILAFLLLALSLGSVRADDSNRKSHDLEFFEKRIRPLLVENCCQCHGEQKQEGGLALNSAAAIQKGGDRGAPLIENDPDNSLLIRAIQYADDDLKMPPKGRLKDEQIADLIAWVRAGAIIPHDDTAPHAVRPGSDFNLQQRAQHWAYQPLHRSSPFIPHPSSFFLHDSIDNFIAAKLAANGLTQSPEAPRRTLIRRATFDLIGLPPDPNEIAAFLSDQTPDAYERLIDRLLASPRYGERFGRHWLDVVRYSESLGFEFDYDLHNAWRYRDYVIRAFNSDLPYNQFVIEHLAGDLVPQPRRHPLDGTNESILATGFWWMHEGKQTPVDIRQDQADRIDNQLDCLGKAFLGQTIACARCHDHKFDAISTRDYYALAGYLRSSRYQQAFIDSPELFTRKIAELQSQRTAIQQPAKTTVAEVWLQQLRGSSRYLTTALNAKDASPDEAQLKELAAERALDLSRLQKWVKAITDDTLSAIDHPLNAITTAATDKKSEQRQSGTDTAFASGDDISAWFVAGHAFGTGPLRPGEIVVGNNPERSIARLTVGGADSGALSRRLQGESRSPSFTIDKKFVHLLAAGHGGRVNLVIDGYTLIMNPMYGKLTVAPTSDRLVWRTIPVDRWVGHRAFLEAIDSTIPMHGLNPPPSSARVPESTDGYIVLKEVVLSDDPEPPAVASLISKTVAERSGEPDLPKIAAGYEREMRAAIDRWSTASWQSDRQRNDDIGLINWLLENGLLDESAIDKSTLDVAVSLTKDLEAYRALEATIPKPHRTPAIADGTGEDEFVFLRGNWRTPGDPTPRGAPEVLRRATVLPSQSVSDTDSAVGNALRGVPSAANTGSGRLNLAHQLVDPSNPLLPRVIVNRLWQHHFGEGLVRTSDDFGRMGQPPSHPELLDWLATELIKSDWSLKTVTRRMVTSATYRQSSTAPPLIPEPRTLNPNSVDPENRLLWHMPIRRLEAEAVRDSMLAVSGRLSDQQYGPSVLPHLTSHMEGRGKPQSGPLDGEGRRSLYLNARRNFLTPMLLAFDYPVTFTPIGRRGASAIPAQALTLMNDPFVLAEAQRWAEKTLSESGSSTEQRLATLYETAFARPPTSDELIDAIDFLQAQSLRHATGTGDLRVWTDLCHVLINVKEFIFIE